MSHISQGEKKKRKNAGRGSISNISNSRGIKVEASVSILVFLMFKFEGL